MVRAVGQTHQGRCGELQLLQGAAWSGGPKEQGDGERQFRARTSALSCWLWASLGTGYPASWPGPRADLPPGRVGMPWLFIPVRAASSVSQGQPDPPAAVGIQTCQCVPCQYLPHPGLEV